MLNGQGAQLTLTTWGIKCSLERVSKVMTSQKLNFLNFWGFFETFGKSMMKCQFAKNLLLVANCGQDIDNFMLQYYTVLAMAS